MMAHDDAAAVPTRRLDAGAAGAADRPAHDAPGHPGLTTRAGRPREEGRPLVAALAVLGLLGVRRVDVLELVAGADHGP
ncbi:hypothetical protein HBB16_21355 [Pseudonocardia sp. MCCB 268]|nr:hypothetical protein [Pseudonocardia cytotoxica]